jgi:excinuclease ABC subunit A
LLDPFSKGQSEAGHKAAESQTEKLVVAQRITAEIMARLAVLLDLGLGYLSLERSTPSLSPGELQRLRLATQLHSNLFGVVYVLDEPSAGLHPADTESLLRALDALKASGNTLFVVEHEPDVIRHADWIVDIGPDAGQNGGGQVLYSGPPEKLRDVEASRTARYLVHSRPNPLRSVRTPRGWIHLDQVSLNNLHKINASIPLRVLTSVTGVSGSGKSSLISQALVDLVADHLGQNLSGDEEEPKGLTDVPRAVPTGRISGDLGFVRRLVPVDQKPIGRTPRSNMATYTGLFDHVRRLFASTAGARARKYDAGRFSFNVAKGRCETCAGEGFVCVELLFLPSVYSPCPTCHGARFNEKTLEIKYRGKNIAEVLAMTAGEAQVFFDDEPSLKRPLSVLNEVGLTYLRLGQSATELSGGEAQRIKLATELQRAEHGNTLYVLDEPTTGLHPVDVERLMEQLHRLVDSGNTVVLVEHDIQVIADCDWVIDMGPGAGEEGGRIVVSGTPEQVATSGMGKTASYLSRYLTD